MRGVNKGMWGVHTGMWCAHAAIWGVYGAGAWDVYRYAGCKNEKVCLWEGLIGTRWL